MSMSLSAFLGTDTSTPLHGGHQAMVFEAFDSSGRQLVAKLRRKVDVDTTILEERMRAVASLAVVDPRVCSPVMSTGGFLTEVIVDGEPMLGTLHEYARGEPLDHADAADARVMGTELARLHDSLSTLPGFDLPLAPALAATGYHSETHEIQLLHGDFSAQNLRRNEGGVSIFDFDDCGYGPREFDVANSLYMVLFDHMTNESVDVYDQFEAAFLDGYNAASSPTPFDVDVISRFIDLRVEALRVWLDDPDSAPVGIQTASQEWRRTLRQFIEAHGASKA